MPPPPRLANKLTCPSSFASFSFAAAFKILSILLNNFCLQGSRQTNAPAFIRFSKAFLFTTLGLILCVKSIMDLNSPFCFRSSSISLNTASPIPFIEFKPNLILSPSGVNSEFDLFISGGRTLIPSFCASVIYN